MTTAMKLRKSAERYDKAAEVFQHHPDLATYYRGVSDGIRLALSAMDEHYLDHPPLT